MHLSPTIIWKQQFTIEGINALSVNTLNENLGIEFIEIGDDYLIGKMPVDNRTIQPLGLLHGGASASLAETIGSVASALCLEDLERKSTVGLEINANHLIGVRSGYVYGKARPVRLGRNIHVWNIEIRDEEANLVCVSRLTLAIVDRKW